MRNLFRFGGPPLLAAVILVFALTGTFHAQPAGNGKGDQAALNQKIRDALFRVLQEGVALHNQRRDYAGCFRVYHGALLAVQPLLDHRPDLQRVISEGLQAAANAPSPPAGGFALRKVIDDVRAGLKEGAPATDKKDKEVLPPPDKELPAKKEKKEPAEKKDGEKAPLDKKEPEKKDADKKDPDKPAKKEDDKEGENAIVAGQVVYKGKPVTSGYVTFVGADQRRYSSSIRNDGSYTFRKVSLPPGEYSVAIEPEPGLKGQGQMVPARFRNPATSGLRVTLKRGGNNADLNLAD
ncbi:MAG: hypothetical protein L0Z62_34160 [Gemmataceae bacterium]|nr:hypothetical protein [Gemmataceae bacterium]